MTTIKRKKKHPVWEFWIQFYLGKNEDCNLGDCLLESSVELLWRGKGGGQCVVQLLSCVLLFAIPWNVAYICDPKSSINGISQARILEWVAISFSRGSSQFRDQTHISCIAGSFLTTELPGKPEVSIYVVFWWKGIYAISTHFDRRLLLVTRRSLPVTRNEHLP